MVGTVQVSSTILARPPVSRQPDLSDESFQLLRNFVYEQTGIFFHDRKKYFLEGRLGKRLQVLNLNGFEDYFRLVKYSTHREQELKFLYEAITINETSLFRNPAQFEAFEQSIVAEIFRTRQTNGRTKLRIWSAGCSSGEEAYTVAMIYLEKLRPQFPGLEIEIVGTDISSCILEAAPKGVFRESSVRIMPKQYLDKYLTCTNARYHICEEVKQFVKFKYLNLYDRDQMRLMRGIDVIFCCNVLIYFDMKSKVQVVSNLYNSLNRGGYLLIGYAEALHGISAAFKVINFPKTVTYKKE